MADAVAIAPRHAAAPGDVLVEMMQLHPQQRRLQLVEPRIDALEKMAVLRLGTVVAQRRDALRQPRVGGHHRAAVAQRAQVLGREETEGRRIAKRTGLAAVARRAVRLRRVLDQQQPVPPGQRRQRRHVGQLAVQVHRHDRARARSDRRFHAGRVEIEAQRIGLHRHRHQPVLADREEAGDEGVAGHDDLVALAERAELPVAAQDQRQRIQPVAHAHRMAHAAVGGELALEGGQFLAHDVPARVDHPRGGRLQLVGMARVDRPDVEERDVRPSGFHRRAGHHSGHS